MYKQFFGLHDFPFNVNPDPRYLFLTPQTQEALDQLTYGIQGRKGLILLTGEVGTGKTTLIHRLLDWLREQQTPTAFIFNSHLEVNHLFEYILADFGVHCDSGSSDKALMRLKQWVFERFRAGDTPVVIVDEAQGLPIHVLEEIRLLLNLETSREKLLQIVLAGQPDLELRLERPELRQIKQRIALRCRTNALTLDETRSYIQARLHIAGANGKPIFTSQAMEAVHFYSRGVPRVINLLCEHSLINTYVDHVQTVPAHIVAEVAREFEFDGNRPFPPGVDFQETLNSNLADTSSRLKSEQVFMPGLRLPSPKEPTQALENCATGPVAVIHTLLSTKEAHGAGILEHGNPLEFEEPAEASKPSDVQMTVLSSPAPMVSPLSPLASKLAPLSTIPIVRGVDEAEKVVISSTSARSLVSSHQETSHRPLKAKPTNTKFRFSTLLMEVHSLRILPRGWGIRWRVWLLSTIASLIRVQWAASQGLKKQSLRRAAAGYHRARIVVASIAWSRMWAPMYRWLQQPWDPTRLRIPQSRLFELRRRFSYKKL
jgi:general secretion pathway protein A